MFLLTVFQVFNRRWHTCVEYEIRLDTLTGVWNRRSFFQRGESMLAETNRQAACYGYFIMVDVDWFKQINDEFGHPEGDRVLHDIAKCLREIFSPIGLIGRLGGDEFAILIDKPVPRQQLEENLDQFARRIDTLSSEASSLTCSIGVLIISRRRSKNSIKRPTGCSILRNSREETATSSANKPQPYRHTKNRLPVFLAAG